jgi:pyruvate dehydrogenase E2 component (dihydrolipoamide acetyltransferase)
MASAEVTAAEVDAFIAAFRPAGAAAEKTVSTVTQATSQAVTDTDISPQARRRATEFNTDLRGLTGSGRRGRLTLQDVEQAARPAHAVGGGSPVSVAVTTAALDVFYASPGAKRLALAHKVDLAKVKPTGPRGRISRSDVARHAGVPLAPADNGVPRAEIVRMSATRKAIARQLTLAKSTIPHYYLRRQVELDALQALRADLKLQKGSAPSLNDYLLRATALALCEVPDVNIQVHGDEIHRFADANIAVAVATDKGLITPVLRAAQRMSVDVLAAELRPLVERARAGQLRSEDIEGGSFTVSNLGMFGVEQFDAIINPPQGAILAVGAARRVPVERDGHIAFGSAVWLSLSCDHRAIDGALGGRFLAALHDLIASPERL